MPAGTIKFPFSKKSGYMALAMLLIIIMLLLRTGIANYQAGDVAGTIIFGVFILAIFALLVLMIITRLIPAWKGETALELDGTCAKDYIRNLVLDWKDVEDIGLKPGRSSAMLVFEMKFESDYGKQIFVSLRWVGGRDADIYKTVLAYFDEAEGIVREDGDEVEPGDESS